MLSFSINPKVTAMFEMVADFNGLDRVDAYLGTSDLIFNKMKGNKSAERTNDPKSYARMLEYYDKIAPVNQKELAIVDSEEMETFGNVGVYEEFMSCVEEGYEEIEERMYAATLLEEYKDMKGYLFVEEGVDLQRLIELVSEGVQKANETLKSLVTKYDMGDMLMGLMRNYKISELRELCC